MAGGSVPAYATDCGGRDLAVWPLLWLLVEPSAHLSLWLLLSVSNHWLPSPQVTPRVEPERECWF